VEGSSGNGKSSAPLNRGRRSWRRQGCPVSTQVHAVKGMQAMSAGFRHCGCRGRAWAHRRWMLLSRPISVGMEPETGFGSIPWIGITSLRATHRHQSQTLSRPSTSDVHRGRLRLGVRWLSGQTVCWFVMQGKTRIAPLRCLAHGAGTQPLKHPSGMEGHTNQSESPCTRYRIPTNLASTPLPSPGGLSAQMGKQAPPRRVSYTLPGRRESNPIVQPMRQTRSCIAWTIRT
jgi:hypothetical protein